MATTANWAQALAPGLKAFISDEYEQFPKDYTKVLRPFDSQKAYEEYVNSTGIGFLLRRNENAATEKEDPLQGYKTRLTPEIFSKGIDVPKELDDDDLYNVINDRGRFLARAAYRTENKIAFEPFRGAFSAGVTSYGDLKPLCSTVHPRTDGGSTQSNASSTGIPLLEENIEVGALALQQVLDDKGQLINVGLDGGIILMAPPALRKSALIFTRSKLRPSTGENDINVYQIEGDYEVFINPWISAKQAASDGDTAGSDTAWFLIAKSDHGVCFVNREAFNLDHDYIASTRTLVLNAHMRKAFGWKNWRGVWGSKGDNAAYSS